MSMYTRTAPSQSMGVFMHELRQRFPKFLFSAGNDMETGRYGIFVHDKCVNGTTIPADPPICFIETTGSEEKEIEVLMVKIAMLHD